MQELKINIQQHGPLRPEVWNKITNNCLTVNLLENENFVREDGMIAFIANGLLKEYDAKQRKRPSIINFIQHHQFFITRKHNHANFIKACTPALIYVMKWEELEALYKQFKELKLIYDSICENYDEAIAIRQLYLEEKDSSTRIKRFILSYRKILPLLKKKDIANYLNLDYNNFVRLYSRLL